MPTIARYGERRETIRQLPAGTKRAAATALSEGAGVAEAEADKFRAFGETAGVIGRISTQVYGEIVQHERQKANQTALVEADNALAEFENRYLWDAQNGALTRKGKSAMGLPEETTAEFDKTAGAIEQHLANDEQRAAFQRLKLQRKQAIDLQVRRHVAGEMQTYQQETLGAKISLGTDATIRAMQSDPKLGAKELASMEGSIDVLGKNLGWSQEKIDTTKAAQRAKIHDQVVTNLIAAGKDQQARDYFEVTQGEIDPKDTARLKAALDEAGDLKNAQAKAQKIITEGGTLTEQREKAKLIEDPQQQEKALQLIEHEHAVREAERLDAQRKSLGGLYNSIDAGNTDLAAIIRSPEYQAITDLGTRNSIRQYVQDRIQGIPVRTDMKAKLDLIYEMRDSPEKFAKRNLWEYRTKLSDADMEQLALAQVSIQKGETKQAEKDVTGLLTTTNILRSTMGDRYDEKKKETLDLLVALNAKAEEHQLRTGKKMLDSELQATADFLYQDVVLKEGTWKVLIPWRGSVFTQALGGTQDRFGDTTKPVRDLTISDIPETEQQQAAASLRKAGKVPTPDLILQEWVRAKKRMGQVRTPR